MGKKEFALGIDIGTTSVKVCIVDSDTKDVLSKQSKDTQANVPSDQGCEGNKQDVPKIISAVHNCISRLPKELLRQVTVIGVCGQMHGVLLWSCDETDQAWERLDSGGINPTVKFEVIKEKVSNLYTWQDSRCDSQFLASLPQAESNVKISTGYGCATLFWFAKNRPEKLARFNCSGTIQDFTTAILCNLKEPIMSTQNAASWGYFNISHTTWNTEVLKKAGFPTQLLPQVVKPQTIIGQLPESWFGIPAGTPVGVALGDFQCSVYATLGHPKEAALNVSTSAQLAYLMEESFCPESTQLEGPINHFPYFNERYLAVGASLNGGNALALFVKMLQQWTLDLGFSVPQAKVWEKLTDLGSRDDSKSSLHVIPTVLGERHAPEQNASILNLDPGNLSLGQVFRALCAGVISNLHSMIPRHQLESSNITKIVGSGSALIRNKILQAEVEAQFGLPVEFVGERGACVGAALSQLSNGI